MKLTLKLRLDNAAFDLCLATETARILKEVAERIEDGRGEGKCRDINGNTVGEWKVTR